MIFVDTNVIVDITSDDPMWRNWSLDRLADAVSAGPTLINGIVFAELAPRFETVEALEAYVVDLGLSIEPIVPPVLFRAGHVHAQYRRSGGARENVLADFFVGAHAEFLGVPLLTRDARHYRTYFPEVELIAP